MRRLLFTVVLIIIALYVGAYVGKENINKGAEVAIQKTKVCYLWVKDTWVGDTSEK